MSVLTMRGLGEGVVEGERMKEKVQNPIKKRSTSRDHTCAWHATKALRARPNRIRKVSWPLKE